GRMRWGRCAWTPRYPSSAGVTQPALDDSRRGNGAESVEDVERAAHHRHVWRLAQLQRLLVRVARLLPQAGGTFPIALDAGRERRRALREGFNRHPGPSHGPQHLAAPRVASRARRDGDQLRAGFPYGCDVAGQPEPFDPGAGRESSFLVLGGCASQLPPAFDETRGAGIATPRQDAAEECEWSYRVGAGAIGRFDEHPQPSFGLIPRSPQHQEVALLCLDAEDCFL